MYYRHLTPAPSGPGEAVMTLHQNPAETLAAVEAELNYLVPTKERPRTYAFDPPPDVPRRPGRTSPHTVSIRNGRPIAAAISLDQYGFGSLRIAARCGISTMTTKSSVSITGGRSLLRAVTGATRGVHFRSYRAPPCAGHGGSPRRLAASCDARRVSRVTPQRARLAVWIGRGRASAGWRKRRGDPLPGTWRRATV